MFEGMVIDGKCLELALEPQNEKDQKIPREDGSGVSLRGNHFF